jgi:hypothetical protein
MNIQIEQDVVIVDGITYHRQDSGANKAAVYERMVDDMQAFAYDMLTHAQSTYDNYGLEKLTLNMAEAEGYLRAAKEMNNYIADLEENFQ